MDLATAAMGSRLSIGMLDSLVRSGREVARADSGVAASCGLLRKVLRSALFLLPFLHLLWWRGFLLFRSRWSGLLSLFVLLWCLQRGVLLRLRCI